MKKGRDLVEALRSLTLPDPPKGAYTRQELADKLGVGKDAARMLAIKSGAKRLICRSPRGKPVEYWML